MKFLPFTPYSISTGTLICPTCKSNKHSPISNWDRRFKRLEHVRCDNCALIRQMPLPSNEALEKYYADEYRSDYQNVSSEPTKKHRRKRINEGQRRLDKLGAVLPQISSILDFGCGSGEFVELCAEKNLEATGFEPGKGYAEYAQNVKSLNVITGSWQELEFEQEFDLITSFHVFEHLVEPLEALQKMKTWLKPKGRIFLETPNLKNALFKGFGCLHFAHTLGFSQYSMEYLGALAGLKVSQVFDEYDIGMVFEVGPTRALEKIADDANGEMHMWSKSKVHRQFWKYTFSKVIGQR